MKETADGNGAYITKQSRNSRRKIDAAVGAVFAHDRVKEYVGAEPWMAWV